MKRGVKAVKKLTYNQKRLVCGGNGILWEYQVCLCMSNWRFRRSNVRVIFGM